MEIDAREDTDVRLLVKCPTCSVEYVMVIRAVHACAECTLKYLYPPDGIKPEPFSWKSFWRNLWKSENQ